MSTVSQKASIHREIGKQRRTYPRPGLPVLRVTVRDADLSQHEVEENEEGERSESGHSWLHECEGMGKVMECVLPGEV